MKKEIKDIIIGQGLGDVKFGLSRESVISLLGEPDERDLQTLAENEPQSEIWHYDELELSLGFDQGENWRLISIAVSAEEYNFESKALLGKSREEVEAFLADSSLADLEMDDLSDDVDSAQCLLMSEESEINFWFEEDVLTEVQWGPLFKDDDTIIWPS